MKKIYVMGGGTVFHVRNHLALCAPAYGTTAMALTSLCRERFPDMETQKILTRMADPESLIETNDDVEVFVDYIKKDLTTKVIFFNMALCDWKGEIAVQIGTEDEHTPAGKHSDRLHTAEGIKMLMLTPAQKIVKSIREGRKDIFLVAFKTTCGASEKEQYKEGLNLLKTSSVNLVLANDTRTRLNMIITPEEAKYHVVKDRLEALTELVDMTFYRSQLTFTRSDVVDGEPISWNSKDVFPSLRTVVEHCIVRNAYKVFNGATVGHFACKIGPREFLTSIRKSNFNNLADNGLVRVLTNGDDKVIAFGAKPSVGGQSQRLVFQEHPEYDCIVHFHCPIKQSSTVPTVSQREYECGSHQCGQNTSRGLQRFGNLSAVYLDNHGPNIVFNHDIDPKEVITFIEDNFDLQGKTGGVF